MTDPAIYIGHTIARTKEDVARDIVSIIESTSDRATILAALAVYEKSAELPPISDITLTGNTITYGQEDEDDD